MNKLRVLIITAILSVSFVAIKANYIDFGFENFKLNNKLPSSSVTCIYNDSEGYVWLGTNDGLCRFDGYDLKIFRSSSITPGIIRNNRIYTIAEDATNRIWIGMQEGVNIIDKNNFTVLKFDNEFVNKDRVSSILFSQDGFVWIATSNNGILRVNPTTFEYERFSKSSNIEVALRSNSVINLFQDNTGRIWFTSWKNGMGYFSKDRKKVYYAPKLGNNNNPFKVYQDSEKNYWVCSWGDGVYKMALGVDGSKIQFKPIEIETSTFSIPSKIVFGITKDDKSGLIWLTTVYGLLILEENADGKFNIVNLGKYIKNTTMLFNDVVKDNNGNLWLGSMSYGAYIKQYKTSPVQHFPLIDAKDKNDFDTKVIKISQTNDNRILFLSARVGIFEFNPLNSESIKLLNETPSDYTTIHSVLVPKNKNEVWLTRDGENFIRVYKNERKSLNYINKISLYSLNGLKNNTILQLFQDGKMNIWIGAYDGVYRMNKQGVLKFIAKLKSVNSITEDNNQNIWVGTDNDGVFKLTPKTSSDSSAFKVQHIHLKSADYESANISSVISMRNGNVYVGTKEGFIYLIGNKQNPIEISGRYGITEDHIQDFKEDSLGFLWIMTTKKIIRFNPKTNTTTYLTNANGVNITNLVKGAFLLTKDGFLIAGGTNGLCRINTMNMDKVNKSIENHVYITDLLIENKSVFSGELAGKFNSKKNILETNYSENNVRIEFSTLDYLYTAKIQYAYKLSNINNEWIYTGYDNRYVNYTSLPVGEYTFMVKASDENGTWSNNITKIKIRILPPFYQTWWAYLSYIIILLIFSFFLVRTISNRIKLRNELRISVIEKEKAEELNQIKLRYFTNISHELLTPLTIIMLQIETLQKRINSEVDLFETMRENVVRLKRLINQILVFRKTESGNIKLCVLKSDIVAFVRNICNSNFKPLIKEKHIDFRIDVEYDEYMAFFDSDKLDKIIYNLLSNAFKYSSVSGTIVVKISFIPRNDIVVMRLSVADNGSGIAEEDLPHIFKRFYISGSSDQSMSHGIGLALTKELVVLHKGIIQVKSQLNEGSVFTIEIPVSENAYTQEEISEDETLSINDSLFIENEDYKILKPDLMDEKLAILVVEDNRELNQMITERFSDKYTVYSAMNGIEALGVLKDKEIDLIISDVMMPEMDGLTLCKVVKNELNTSHINFLMLTAKNSTEDRIECYNAGADAYISKPFEMSVLYARVQNLINRRLQKTENFQHNHDVNVSSMEYSSIDELFINESIAVVEQNIMNEGFDFDQFAIAMSTSKSTLHRKIKSLTGLAPGEFIKNIRLKHALKMFDNRVGNISEIAYAVGFNDPKYFSKCFKLEFGLTPREYINKKSKTNKADDSDE